MSRIKHSGIVKSIDEGHIRVQITQTSACSSCKVAGHCNASESKEKIVDIYNVDNPSLYHIGDEVVVSATGRMGYNAVLLAFGIPFIVMLVFIYASFRLTHNEPVSAIVGLISLVLYYVILYTMRSKLSTKFAFKIDKE